MIYFLIFLFFNSSIDKTGAISSESLTDHFKEKKVQYCFMVDRDTLKHVFILENKKRKSFHFSLLSIDKKKNLYTLKEGKAKRIEDLGNLEDAEDECGGGFFVNVYYYKDKCQYLEFRIGTNMDRATIIEGDQCNKKFSSMGTFRRVPWKMNLLE